MTSATGSDGPAGFREALVALQTRQKTSKGGPAYSLLVNRRLGRLLAALAYVLGRTPNQVTAVSGACTFAGIAMIAVVSPSPAASFGITLLLVLGYALDAADGQLARLRGGGSVAGEWLDHVVDAAKIATLHLAVLVGWFNLSDRPAAQLAIPIAYQVVASVMFFVIILNDQLRRSHRGTTDMLLQGEVSSSRLYSFAVMPTDYGLLCLVFALHWWEDGFTAIYSGLMACNALFLVLALVRWFREMRTY